MVHYINHKKPLTADGHDDDNDSPNVRIVWPKNEMIAHKPDWLTKDINFLRDTTDKIGLSFDFIALRNIRKGEEITMDYGDEWEEAWKEHVKHWAPPEDVEEYVHSRHYIIPYLRTLGELETDPYPTNLHTMCNPSFRQDGNGRHAYQKSTQKSNDRVHCSVLKREMSERLGTNVYQVELVLPNNNDTADENTLVVVDGFPRGNDGIQLYDKAYSTSWHLPNAFRHKMSIPDDMFPESWMNIFKE
jgi:SET domain